MTNKLLEITSGFEECKTHQFNHFNVPFFSVSLPVYLSIYFGDFVVIFYLMMIYLFAASCYLK